MFIEVSIFIGILCWTMSSIMTAAMFGAMISPEKPKLLSRIIITCLLLIPSLIIIPLSLVATILLSIILIVLLLTTFGIKITLELLRDGIPEIDDDGNIIEVEEPITTPPTAPWV